MWFAGSSSQATRTSPGRLLSGVAGLGRDRGHWLAVVFRFAHGEDRAIAPLRPEPWHRLRQVGGGHHEPDARHGHRGRRVDRADPGARDVKGHEFDVENVIDREVRDVRLVPRHAPKATDPGRRRADTPRHCGATSASGVDARSPIPTAVVC